MFYFYYFSFIPSYYRIIFFQNKILKKMENSPFRQKIQKQHEVVLKQLGKFRHAFEGKTIKNDKIGSYCDNVTYFSDLYSTYVHNCMEYFNSTMKNQMLAINKYLFQDLIRKIRYIAQASNNSDQKYTNQKKEMCQICSTKIRQVDVKLIKQQLSDDAFLRKNLFKKIYSDFENENTELFSKDQDEMFFKFLNRVLIKKEEVLSMQTKQINDFLLQVTKSFNDLNFLTEYAPVKINSNQFNQNYKEQLQKTLTNSLKHSFSQKIPAWIQKVFQKFKKSLSFQKKANCSEIGCQTSEQVSMQYIKKRSQYAANGEAKRQIQALKEEIQKSIHSIQDLKNKLTVLERQKQQLEAYYTKQISELMLGKRKIELELKRTETDFFNLKQLQGEEIAIMKKKLSKKKTQPRQNQQSISNIEDSKGIVIHQKEKENNQQILISKRKKKTPLNKLFSKKSEITKHSIIDLQQNDTFQKSMNSFQNSTSNVLKSNQKDEYHENDKTSQEFLKQLSITKKNSKKQKNSKSRHSKESASRVQFQLDSAKQLKPKQSQIPDAHVIIEENQSKNSMTESNKSIPKIIKKLSSKKDNNNSKMKRMLSIQAKISPIIKTSRQGLNKKIKNSENTNENDKQLTKLNLTSKKKVFQYVPLENSLQYFDLKRQVSQITNKIEIRNTQKLKTSVKNIKINFSEESSKELGKIYGFSIFSKKSNSQQKYRSNQQVQNSLSTQSKETDNVIQNEKQWFLNQDRTKTLTNQGIQTSMKLISIQTSKDQQKKNLMDQIDLEQRKKLFQNLKAESILPKHISFNHYQILIRKLFGDKKKSSQIKNSVLRQRSSANVGNLSRYGQKQSIKINIDSKILDQIHEKGKALLNLPKLNQSPPHNRISSIVQKVSLNTFRQKNIEQHIANISSIKNYTQNQKQHTHHNRSSFNPQLFTLRPTLCQADAIFESKDLNILFQNEFLAYEYQKSTKNNVKNYQLDDQNCKNSYKFNEKDRQIISSLFMILSEIKAKNHAIYHKVCSFIRYPYQTVKNGFDFINIAKDITFETWVKHLQRIYSLNCGLNIANLQQKSAGNKQNGAKEIGPSSFQKFIQPFQQKLAELLILASK